MKIGFSELYGENQENQRARYEELARGFEEYFGKGKLIYCSAPGRSEIGGNHTDHNHGRVVAAAVDLDVAAAACCNGENAVRLKSKEYPEMDVIDLSDLSVHPEETGRSASLLRGICARVRELGYRVGGFNAYTSTRVLKGSGLSSSAAFEVLAVTIISHLFNDGKIDPVEVAKIAQYAENVYFGKPSGLLDQTASSVGGFTAIDFANPEKPAIEKIDFDISAQGYALCVVDTGGNHADLTGDYAGIPQEMKAAASFFGKKVLREVDPAEFEQNIAAVRKACGDRAVLRAMHFFAENARAAMQRDALRSGDFQAFLKLVVESGRSSFQYLQNVYAPHNPAEQGLSVALALSEKLLDGCGAWRVHGGGFAGTIQAYVPFDLLETYRSRMEAVFGEGSSYVLSVRAAGGTRVEL